ncbi:MAG: hypothetical protein L0Z55_09435 [Planctomycetes bacterium]|nr:hypothetical protein [Planctomycetota bacterium]
MKANGFLLIVLVACGIGLLGLVQPTSGQVIVVGAGEGEGEGEGAAGFVIEGLDCGDGAFGHVFALQEDNEWTNAKSKLIELAANGKRIAVIYALESVGAQANEKHKTRIQSVITALTESGAYPLTMADFTSQTKKLEASVKALKSARTVENDLAAVLMAMERASSELDNALKASQSAAAEPRNASAPAGKSAGAK